MEKNNKCIDEFSLIHYTNNSVVFMRIKTTLIKNKKKIIKLLRIIQQ